MQVQPVDPHAIPELNGVFEPTQDELDVADVKVVQGSIPGDLAGTYLRNGPNCRFAPLGSYTYPLDGDGMVHAVTIEDGRARYRNRYVHTPSLAAEEKAGRSLWGGVMTPSFPDAGLVGPELAGRYKDLPDIHIVHHGGRYLALAESDRPFEMTSDLDTVGPWDFGGALPKGLCAHPKIDPVTGEMVVFRYDFEDPFLTWAVVGADGAVTHAEEPIELDQSFMIHDFVITPTYVVLFVCPAVFDFFGGGLVWKPELGTRIAVIPRAGSNRPTRWIDTGAFWVWHFANAFERTADDGTTEVVVDYPRWDELGLGKGARPATGGVTRARLHPEQGTVAFEQYDDRVAEFPRLDDRRVGQPYRYFHVAGKETGAGAPGMHLWNVLYRYDMETGRADERRCGSLRLGEAIFAPSASGTGENDGYVMTFATDAETLESYFLILHAGDIAGEPAATLRFGHRVPAGLHGSWVPAGT